AFVSRRGALMAGAMMATSVLLGVEARLAKTDAMLLLTTVAALGAMARAYLVEQGDRATSVPPLAIAAIFWGAIAAGVLIKGPIILMFVGFAAVALVAADRSGRWLWRLKPAIGLPFALALIMPWLVAIVIRSDGNFLTDALGQDMFAKVTGGQETHGMPPGAY